MKELAGGKISSEIIDLNPTPAQDFVFELSLDRVNSLIGKQIPEATVRTILDALEVKILKEEGRVLTVAVPPYRVDVQRDCDVVEDILRIYGYNNVEIPSAVKSSLTIKGNVDAAYKLENLVSEQLVGCGFNEILNNSLTREAYYDGLQTYKSENLVRLMNPLSSDLNVMRQSLLFGGLEVVRHNVNRRNANLRLFEFGNCYYFNEGKRNPEKVLSAYSEDQRLGLWVTGKRVEGSWAHPNEESSFYELKAYVMNILVRIGLPMGGLLIENGENDIFTKSIVVKDRNRKVYLELGLVKKAILAAFDIEQEVYYADLNWTLLTSKVRGAKVSFKEISKFPAVSRDLALLVDKQVTFAQIEKVCFAADKKLLKKVELFDVYEGKNLEAGKKSYAINLTLQDEDKTMNDKQTDNIMQKIVQNLEKQLGAKLR